MNKNTFILAVAFIPVWIITKFVVLFFPEAHSWKHQKLTLMSWVKYGTLDALWFSLVFWAVGIAFVSTGIRLLYLMH